MRGSQSLIEQLNRGVSIYSNRIMNDVSVGVPIAARHRRHGTARVQLLHAASVCRRRLSSLPPHRVHCWTSSAAYISLDGEQHVQFSELSLSVLLRKSTRPLSSAAPFGIVCSLAFNIVVRGVLTDIGRLIVPTTPAVRFTLQNFVVYKPEPPLS